MNPHEVREGDAAIQLAFFRAVSIKDSFCTLSCTCTFLFCTLFLASFLRFRPELICTLGRTCTISAYLWEHFSLVFDIEDSSAP